MELQSRARAKKLWRLFRIVFYMMKKTLASKRKFIMDMNITLKTFKLVGKSLKHISVLKNNNSRNMTLHGLGLREYEFSCSNSPFHAVSLHAKAKHGLSLFSCIKASSTAAEKHHMNELVEYSQQCEYELSVLALGQQQCSPSMSPFAAKVCSYSSEDEDGNEDADEATEKINDKAEEFIKRFYEQLRAQSQIALLC